MTPALKRVLNYQKRLLKFLPRRDAFRFVLNNTLRREELVETRIGGVPISLRTFSSDLNVAAESLVLGEYDVVRCEAPKVIIDAGANIGTSAVAFARRFPDATIYSIEMEPGNFRLLEKNTKAYPNIVTVHAALASQGGMRNMVDRQTGSWGFTLMGNDLKSADGSRTVNAITLDELMLKFGVEHIDILKMDIEGAEKEIFEAGGEWLSKSDILIVELHDRICMGCDRAFYLATREFAHFEKFGEKVCAYRRQAPGSVP